MGYYYYSVVSERRFRAGGSPPSPSFHRVDMSRTSRLIFGTCVNTRLAEKESMDASERRR